MPPKVKTDRAEILSAAFEVAKTEGLGAITAQSVSQVLKTSIAPVFRVFQTVEELRTATAEKIKEFHTQYIKDYPIADETSQFLTYGLAYIRFAKEHPQLFETIMLPCPTDIDERMMTDSLAFVLDSARDMSGLDLKSTKTLFLNMWIYTHGIACLVYKGSLSIPENEEKNLLSAAYYAFLKTAEN